MQADTELAHVVEATETIAGLARHRYRRLSTEQQAALAGALIAALDALEPTTHLRLVSTQSHQKSLTGKTPTKKGH